MVFLGRERRRTGRTSNERTEKNAEKPPFGKLLTENDTPLYFLKCALKRALTRIFGHKKSTLADRERTEKADYIEGGFTPRIYYITRFFNSSKPVPIFLNELRLSSRELHRERIPTIYKEKIVYMN